MENKTMGEKIAELKKIAMNNYEKGGDSIIECWDNETWIKFIDDCDRFCRPYTTCLYELMGFMDEQIREIEATAF